MADTRILVVDDEPDLLELVSFNLSKAGYRVVCVKSGEEALAQIPVSPPDLLVLDLLLPGVDGLDVCKALKQNPLTTSIPIIMLTARSEEADIVTGLELGADDYLTKPFSPRILLARVKAALRRVRSTSQPTSAVIIHGTLTIHPGHHEVHVGDQSVRLTPTEFNILHLLAQRPGWVFTRYQIVDAARGNDAGVTERSVDVHIAALRRKLGRDGEAIETVRGIGYRLQSREQSGAEIVESTIGE
jgi:two-component system phosphate regulon response regulator PhoB